MIDLFKKNRPKAPINNFQLQILQLLKYRPMYGYEILNIFAQKGWKPNTGTLYPALKQLEKKGFIEAFQTEPTRGFKNRSNYKLTKKGFDYVQTTFNINIRHPELYIKPFLELRKAYFDEIIKLKALILDFVNFINPENVLKLIFPQNFPPNIEFKKVYDFNLENPKSQIYDGILLFLPFSFTYRELSENPSQSHLKVLKDVKLALKPEGRILVIDIEYTKHALVDILSFMVSGVVNEMAYTEAEFKKLLTSAGYKNIQVLKKENGIIIIMAQNSEYSSDSNNT